MQHFCTAAFIAVCFYGVIVAASPLAEFYELVSSDESAPWLSIMNIPDDVAWDAEQAEHCDGCKELSLSLRHNFQTIEKEDLREKLFELCDKLPGLKSPCLDIMINHYNDVYAFVSKELQTNDICQSKQICIKPEATSAADVSCKQCRQLVNKQFKQLLQGYCALTHNFKRECLSLLDEYAHDIYSLLKSKVDAQAVCIFAGVCHKQVAAAELPELSNIVADDELDMNEVSATADICSLCEFELNISKSFIDTPAKRNFVLQNLNESCSLLPKFYAQHCQQIVSKYGPLVLQYLSTLTTKDTCELLPTCHKASAADFALSLEAEQQLSANPKCSACKQVVKVLKGVVQHSANIDVAKQACKKLKGLKHICTELIKKSAHKIIEMLKSHKVEGEICKAVGACKHKTFVELALEQAEDEAEEQAELSLEPATELELPAALEGYNKCKVCEELVNTLKSMAHANENIQNALNHVCLKLKAGRPCAVLAKKYGAKIVELMSRNMDTPTICAALNACHHKLLMDFELDESQALIEPTLQMNERDTFYQRPATSECEVCNALMQHLKYIVVFPKENLDIKYVMSKACQSLKHLSNECQLIVTQHGDQIVQLLKKNQPLKLICNEIKVCQPYKLVEDDYLVWE
ncbi:proactivator polypeptide-like 1 [Drosophila busckii]|uniref:proactivator polypeptide-like 1 n=1 Tax=Drosophila busckii TaxID=30019 RepID=UPI00083EEA22|nr:proactivator polypeptide-like 1 [Drosophila busckii]